MNLRRIGISGLMGAGKTTCAGLLFNALHDNGETVKLVDADAEAKSLMRGDKALQKKLVESFGESVVRGGKSFLHRWVHWHSAQGRISSCSTVSCILCCLNGLRNLFSQSTAVA
jgi:hypothetical protein